MEGRYARVAREAAGLVERDLDAALDTVRRFIEPVLDGTAAERWSSDTLTWSEAGEA